MWISPMSRINNGEGMTAAVSSSYPAVTTSANMIPYSNTVSTPVPPSDSSSQRSPTTQSTYPRVGNGSGLLMTTTTYQGNIMCPGQYSRSSSQGDQQASPSASSPSTPPSSCAPQNLREYYKPPVDHSHEGPHIGQSMDSRPLPYPPSLQIPASSSQNLNSPTPAPSWATQGSRSPPQASPAPSLAPQEVKTERKSPLPDQEDQPVKSVNYEELKMKIAYKKFERECIMEFDGDTVLCRVCGDKASGFHYGVHACEGCKGFFRRSIQQKIQYRPCLKNQQCNIMRVNRNRCQYCRLKKCIAVGMSRDAVRFGRVPKKEKAKILEQMQRVNAQSQQVMLSSVLETETNLVQKIVDAHEKTCEYTRTKFASFYEKAWTNPKFLNCPAHMACPLNPAPEEDETEKWEEFTDCFTPAIRNVVNFAKCIPGFAVFSQEDQVTLLKAGTFEVLLVHLSCMFDHKSNTMLFANGKLYKRSSMSAVTSSAGFLLDSMFDFAERMNELKLTDEEMALFSAIVIIAADRPGLRNVEHVERVQSRISQGLHSLMKVNHPDDPAAYAKLLTKIPDLRTLNTLHSEKLLGLTVPVSQGPDGCPVPTGSGTSLPAADEMKHPRVVPHAPTSGGSIVEQKEERCPYPSSLPSSSQYLPPAVSMAPHYSPMFPQRPASPPTVTPKMEPGLRPNPANSRGEVVLQTPMGTFHRSPSMSAGPIGSSERPRSTSPPVDHIETDLPTGPKGKEESQPSQWRPNPRESAYPVELSRKRPLGEMGPGDVPCKLAKLYNLWEYDMRSNRSNSMSSNSSTESADSAYRSCPGTPRSMLHGTRSPFQQPTLPSTPEAPEGEGTASPPAKKPSSPLAAAPVTPPGVSSNSSSSSGVSSAASPKTGKSASPTHDESVLKHALSMPPLVAQHTWFHQPGTSPNTASPNSAAPTANPNLLEISRRAAEAALGSSSSGGSSGVPSLAPPNLQWQPPASTGLLAPAAPFPPSMMYQHYSQLAAMQQYAAMQQLQQQHAARLAAAAAAVTVASGKSNSTESAPLNLTTKSPPLAIKAEPL